MADTNIKIFNETSQNMSTDSEYDTDVQRRNGVVPGIAKSEIHNKLFRQFSVMGYSIAKFMVDNGYDCFDYDPNQISINLAQAIINVAKVGTNPFNFSWLPATNYRVGDIIFPTSVAVGAGRGFWMQCITAGRTGDTEPSWTAPPSQIDDGLCRWKIMSMLDAATVDGRGLGYSPGNIPYLNSAGKILEGALTSSTKNWWMPNTAYTSGLVITPLSAPGGMFYTCTSSGLSGNTEPNWPTGSGTTFSDGNVVWVSGKVADIGGSIGTISWPTYEVKPNHIKLNGALLTRAAYPGLWAWASGRGVVVTEAQWQERAAGTGLPHNTGYFSSGDGATTFRVPDFRGYFLRVLDESRGLDPDGARNLASAQPHSYQSHSHPMTLSTSNGESGVWGRCWWSSGDSGKGSGTNWTGAAGGTETRPSNISLYATIQYK